MTINDLTSSLQDLNKQISKLLRESDFENYDDLSGLEINYESAEERFILREYREIMDSLDQVNRALNYLKRPIKGIYQLHKNSRDRYECDCKEFTSGNSIEAYIFDEFEERFEWIASRVEHNGHDYYIVGFPETPLEGLRIRVREEV